MSRRPGAGPRCALDEADLAEAGGLAQPLGLGQLRLRHIDAGDVASGPTRVAAEKEPVPEPLPRSRTRSPACRAGPRGTRRSVVQVHLGPTQVISPEPPNAVV